MIVAIVGPTASGKTALGMGLARYINAFGQARFPGGAEIISADAMALYRGMDIGTAKPDIDVRTEVPHHLIDVLYPDDRASVAAYQSAGRAIIAEVHSRGALAIVVGGSGLYTRALLDDIQFPPRDDAVRARLESELEAKGAPELHARLLLQDPDSGKHILPNNGRRIVRALEAIEITGAPFSATLPQYTDFYPHTSHWTLQWQRRDLDEMIFARTRQMFALGLVEETARLLADQEHPLGRTARAATGYAQACAVIEGTLEREQAIELTAIATRQLSRKQMTWYKRDPRITPLPITGVNQAGAEIEKWAVHLGKITLENSA